MNETICSSELCTGCGACVNICPKNCIALQENNEGFWYPSINQDACVDCGRCQKICPALHPLQPAGNEPFTVWKAYSKDHDVLQRSTSGGVFSELSRQVLKQGGVVFGALLDRDLSVSHQSAQDFAAIEPFCGSKYIGSNVKTCFREAKEFLKAGRNVLFSGTPCQIAGLRAFLGKEYPTLITCDFICHGVGSARVFRSYLAHLTGKDSEASHVRFREKDGDYLHSQFTVQITDRQGEKRQHREPSYEGPFGRAFAYGKINRLSCAQCPYASPSRMSDLTLSDLVVDLKEEEKKKGASMVLINTQKGESLFSACTPALETAPLTLDFAKRVQPHLLRPQKANPDRKRIFQELDSLPFSELSRRYFESEPVPRVSFLRRAVGKIKRTLFP